MARIIKVFTDKEAAMRFIDTDLRMFGDGRIRPKVMDGQEVFQVIAADTVKKLYFDRVYQDMKRSRK